MLNFLPLKPILSNSLIIPWLKHSLTKIFRPIKIIFSPVSLWSLSYTWNTFKWSSTINFIISENFIFLCQSYTQFTLSKMIYFLRKKIQYVHILYIYKIRISKNLFSNLLSIIMQICIESTYCMYIQGRWKKLKKKKNYRIYDFLSLIKNVILIM